MYPFVLAVARKGDETYPGLSGAGGVGGPEPRGPEPRGPESGLQKFNNRNYRKSLYTNVTCGTMEVNQSKQKTKEEVKK